jgi:hypothetical protein
VGEAPLGLRHGVPPGGERLDDDARLSGPRLAEQLDVQLLDAHSLMARCLIAHCLMMRCLMAHCLMAYSLMMRCLMAHCLMMRCLMATILLMMHGSVARDLQNSSMCRLTHDCSITMMHSLIAPSSMAHCLMYTTHLETQLEERQCLDGEQPVGAHIEHSLKHCTTNSLGFNMVPNSVLLSSRSMIHSLMV